MHVLWQSVFHFRGCSDLAERAQNLDSECLDWSLAFTSTRSVMLNRSIFLSESQVPYARGVVVSGQDVSEQTNTMLGTQSLL